MRRSASWFHHLQCRRRHHRLRDIIWLLNHQWSWVLIAVYHKLYQSVVLYALWAILAWLPSDCLFLKVFPQNSHSTCCSIPLCLATMWRFASDFCINPFPQIVQLARPSTPLEMNSSATKPCKNTSIFIGSPKMFYNTMKKSHLLYTPCVCLM